jgi:hypothetical protein
MNPATQKLDAMLAYFQFAITLIWLLGLFGILMAIGKGWIDKNSIPMDSVLTTTSIIVFFWFQRTRQQTPIDGTVTTTTTTPGASTTTTAPIAAAPTPARPGPDSDNRPNPVIPTLSPASRALAAVLAVGTLCAIALAFGH